MDGNYCCVPQCHSSGSHIPRPSFHRFPNEKDESSKRLRAEWIRILKIGKPVSKRMVVCGKHFQPSDFFPQRDGAVRKKLKKNAVPSQNLPLSSCENEDEIRQKREASFIRLERKNRRERLKVEQPLPVNDDISGAIIHGLFDDVPAGPSFTCQDPHQLDIDYGMDESINLQNVAVATEELTCMKKMNSVATQVTSGDLLMSRSFINNMDDGGLKTLTGLQSSALLNLLVEILQSETNKNLKKHQMPMKEQIILTLMRLKLDVSFAALSVLFECTAPTCKSIFKDVLKVLAAYLKFTIKWLPKEVVLNNMPQCFKNYTKTRVVLDCTEVVVTKPECLKCKVMTYSQYYTDHTIKVMIGISPGGLVTFLSPVFGGRASDRAIFEQSKILEFLQPHEDAVMVDKGFLVDEACSRSFIELLRPPFLRSKAQFSSQEAVHNTRIARARVHVERMIQRIKIFKIFEGRIPWGMLPYVQDIFTVCAGLANLGNPILSEDKF